MPRRPNRRSPRIRVVSWRIAHHQTTHTTLRPRNIRPPEAEARRKRRRRLNRLLLLAENTAETATRTALNTTRDAPRQAVAPPTPQPAKKRSTTPVHNDRSP